MKNEDMKISLEDAISDLTEISEYPLRPFCFSALKETLENIDYTKDNINIPEDYLNLKNNCMDFDNYDINKLIDYLTNLKSKI